MEFARVEVPCRAVRLKSRAEVWTTLSPGTRARITSGRSRGGKGGEHLGRDRGDGQLRVDELRFVLRSGDHDGLLPMRLVAFRRWGLRGSLGRGDGGGEQAQTESGQERRLHEMPLFLLGPSRPCASSAGAVPGSTSRRNGASPLVAAAPRSGTGLGGGCPRGGRAVAGQVVQELRGPGAPLRGGQAIMRPVRPSPISPASAALVTGAGSARGIGFACARLPRPARARGSRSPRRPSASTSAPQSSRPWASTAIGVRRRPDRLGAGARPSSAAVAERLRPPRHPRQQRGHDVGLHARAKPAPSRRSPTPPSPRRSQRNLATAFYVTRAARRAHDGRRATGAS